MINRIYTSLYSRSGLSYPLGKIVRNDFNRIRGPRWFVYVAEKRKIAAQHGDRKYSFSRLVCRLKDCGLG